MFRKLLAVFGIMACCGVLHAQTLDGAIKNAASETSGRLESGSTVVVINFQSHSVRLTDYVIDELNSAIVNIGKLKPVERRRLDAVQNELNFNMSGEVSDASAQSIGRMLGAQYIVMGSIEIIGSMYRIRFQTITTETATIQYVFSENIGNDRVLESLLQGTNYLVDFTIDQRLTASVLNAVFGIGSFLIEDDKRGGTITATVEGIGAVLFVGSLIYNSAWHHDITEGYEAYPFYIGLGAYLGGFLYGIIRAQIYHKPGSQIALPPFNGFGIDLVSSTDNNFGMKISYTWRL